MQRMPVQCSTWRVKAGWDDAITGMAGTAAVRAAWRGTTAVPTNALAEMVWAANMV